MTMKDLWLPKQQDSQDRSSISDVAIGLFADLIPSPKDKGQSTKIYLHPHQCLMEQQSWKAVNKLASEGGCDKKGDSSLLTSVKGEIGTTVTLAYFLT